ncbi:MAG: hypothetical protein N4A35_06550 [Flavobacteriales bacterium]|jgi:hypothetical protein|nr:hypothetical protein [Flavobacteriales bacterium]
MHNYTAELLNHCSEFAKELFEETADLYPFGAFISKVEQVHPLELEPENKKSTKNGQVVDTLLNYLKPEFERKEILAYATVYEVTFQINEGEAPTNAFAVDIINSESEEPIFYYPYVIEDGLFIFEAPFAVKRA